MKNILSDIEALGYIGEEKNKLLAYLVSISRKLDDPLSAIVISESSAGKSALSDAIERLTPPEDIVYLSTLTPKALYYMNKPQRELLGLIKEMAKERGLEVFSRKEIRDYTGYPHHKVRDMTKDLEELEYLILESGANGKRKLYRLSEVKEEGTHILRELTRPDDLKWRRWRDIKCSKRQE